MSNVTKYFPLMKLFKCKRGNSKYTKAYCDKNKGDYEVFTGTTIGTFGKIDTYDYDKTNLTFTTDGEYAGTVSILSGQYNVGGHRAILIPLKGEVCLEYFRYILQPLFFETKRSNCVPTVTWQIIKDLKIPVPVKADGAFDIEKQISIAERYKLIETRRHTLLEDRLNLISSTVDIDLTGYKYRNFSVKSLFNLNQPSNNSKFTKSFIKENPGNIPVYGATKVDGEVGYGYVCDNAEIIEVVNGRRKAIKIKYFENCLTYNIDGSAGFIFYRNGRFSLSEKVKPLVVFDEFNGLLDPEYLKYIMQPIFRENVQGRIGPNGQNEFTKINKTIIQDLQIPIPIKEDGTFDIDAQKAISSKYKRVEAIKLALCKQIDSVLEIQVDL